MSEAVEPNPQAELDLPETADDLEPGQNTLQLLRELSMCHRQIYMLTGMIGGIMLAFWLVLLFLRKEN